MNNYHVSALKDKTLTKIDREFENELVFHCESGEVYRMYHSQDCCEDVHIDDIVGSLDDLIGAPILMAEEVTNISDKESQNSFTWTFYKFATIKGYVTIRWYGWSNGYYSETVNFALISAKKENDMSLPIKTLADIRALDPCYDPSRYAPGDWQGTALDVLKADQVPVAERLWVVCNEGWIDHRTLRLFAAWCAEQVLPIFEAAYPNDTRPRDAIDTARRYVDGEATDDELAAACAAARSAAYAARDAAWAAGDAARDAAWSAAKSAAGDVSWAAWSSWDAARDAAGSAAGYAAKSAAGAAQIGKLIEMLEGE